MRRSVRSATMRVRVPGARCEMIEPAGLPPGRRIQHCRERAGMSRRVLGGLIDRSAEWVKAVETGRLQTPRLTMLLRIARALGVDDLAVLTGDDQAVPVQVFTSEPHAALAAVRAALTGYQVTPAGTAPSVDHLGIRLEQAWAVRHSSPDHRTQLGAVLPGLIGDAQRAVRLHTDARGARRLLARVYQLTDFYVAYQPAPELVWLVADRAMREARDADDPYLIGGSAWALVQALRDSGRWDEAMTVAHDASGLLDLADVPDNWRAMWGALQIEAGYVLARRGRAGEAWGYWDRANDVAERRPLGYRHAQTSFGRTVMRAHAVTVNVELRQAGEAVRTAESFDSDTIASVPRRSRHLVEVARAHHQRRDPLATLTLLDKAQRTAPETASYNNYARSMALELLDTPPAGFRAEARDLAARIGVLS